MAAFHNRLRRDEPAAPCTTAPFNGVAPGAFFYAGIGWLVAEDVTVAYVDGGLQPVTQGTRQAMAAFMHRFDVLDD